MPLLDYIDLFSGKSKHIKRTICLDFNFNFIPQIKHLQNLKNTPDSKSGSQDCLTFRVLEIRPLRGLFLVARFARTNVAEYVR